MGRDAAGRVPLVAPLRVKICGLRRREDVLAADEAGADYVGVVLTRGFARTVEAADARALVEGVRAVPVAVLVDEPLADAVARAEALGAGVLQLHGAEPVDVVRALSDMGRWTLWKSVRVRAAEDVDRAVEAYGDRVDGLLLEGWKQGVVGGGGARLAPEALGGPPAGIRERVPERLDVVLAGGLHPDNVADAVARFAPDVVDVSSGVEDEPGRKSHDLIRLFVRRARDAATGRTPGSAEHAPDADRPNTTSRRESPS